LEIVDCIPGLKSSKFHSYIEDNAYTTPFLAGDHWVRNVLQMRQFLYNVIGVELETMTKDLKYEAEVTDAISKAMAAEAYSPAVAQGPTPEYLITPAFIASKFFATLTTQGLEKAKEFLEEIKQVVHKYDEKNILLIRLLEHFDREKFHQLVARVAGASRVTTARQGIFFPDQALEGLAPVLGGGDRPSPTATG